MREKREQSLVELTCHGLSKGEAAQRFLQQVCYIKLPYFVASLGGWHALEVTFRMLCAHFRLPFSLRLASLSTTWEAIWPLQDIETALLLWYKLDVAV